IIPAPRHQTVILIDAPLSSRSPRYKADGRLRRLRPSEAVRAACERAWRLSRSSYGVSLAVSIPRADEFLFEPASTA
ncbi:MAG: hypothetical protein K2X71_09420, partial [Methylobacterium sp.]|nr:hypothetical protein [Methylobacterium sp.]